MTSYEQWRALLVARSEQRLDEEGPIDGVDLLQRTYGTVQTVVLIPASWPGLTEPEDVSEAVEGRTRKRFGRWVLDDTGLVCLGQNWDIDSERFDELDWVAHCLGSSWCYDPTDFFDGLQEARRAFCAHLGENWIDAAVWEEIRAVLAGGDLPVYPSGLIDGQRVYLPNRMSVEQRDAFAMFLAKQGVYASR